MAEEKRDRGTPQKSSVDKWLDSAWNLLKSMRFAIILLLVITAASIFNLFANEFIVPAGGGPQRAAMVYEQAYGGLRADVLMFMQMYSPYRSWWYTLMLGLLMLSLIVCVIDRAPTIWRLAMKSAFPASGESVEEMAEHAKLNPKVTLDRFVAQLKKSGYRVQSEQSEGTVKIDATKNQWSRWGAWLTHIGFILLVVGAALIARGEYNDRVAGLPGEMLGSAAKAQQWGFNVRVDDFVIEYYDLGANQWVIVDDRIIGQIIEENGDGTFDVETYSPRMGVMTDLPADRIKNRIDRRMQGGRLDAGNIADYLCTLTVIENGEEIFTDQIEVNSPLRYKGYRFYQSAYDDRRTDAEGRWTTIINVRRDNGAPFVWAGILIVSIGLTMGMYFVPKRIVAVSSGSGIIAGGRTERSRTLFAEEFATLIQKAEQGGEA